MIDLKSNLDHLESLAADFHSDGHAQTATDFRTAIMDISNLRDSNAILERNIREMSAEINDLTNQRKGIASALLAAVSPDLDRRIDEHVKTAFNKNERLDAFEARLEGVEHVTADLDADSIDGLEQMIDDRIEEASCGNDRDDETRDTVRDMIRDGEIIVTVDLS
jgi:hypothetical protein